MESAREVRFTIPGRVGGKGRPRFTVVGGHARAYTPAKTASMEAVVRQIGADAMAGADLLDGALHLTIVVNLNRPASWSKRKRAENPIPTGKPDLDNVTKLIGDSLNGIVWRDDSQIASLHVGRRFVEGGEHTEIYVTQLRDAYVRAAA
jgi:Holliday junction resolvase RusA-like endonuclease